MVFYSGFFSSSDTLLWTLFIISVSYMTVGGIYRLYFSPLADIPGPRLAALTLWYEFYHDFLRKGKYLWVIAEMHAKYGMTLPDCLNLYRELAK